ncbi:MAG: hypothetical protein J2P34_02390, partial [Actinobacteria bacterium]|nr:hypothetical protein [Actinomycetota bacterium]
PAMPQPGSGESGRQPPPEPQPAPSADQQSWFSEPRRAERVHPTGKPAAGSPSPGPPPQPGMPPAGEPAFPQPARPQPARETRPLPGVREIAVQPSDIWPAGRPPPGDTPEED